MKAYQITLTMLVEAIDEQHAETQATDAIVFASDAYRSGAIQITEAEEVVT